jgi:hypothetical protein
MKKVNKLPKLRKLKCVICGIIFYRHISPSEITGGRGKVCGQKCKCILNGNQKRKGEFRKCIKCGKEYWSRPTDDRRGYIKKYCSRKCYHPTKRGNAISYDGYLVINGVKVHRILMEKYLGRKLLSTEIVHHINGNKFDNRLENLQIVSRSLHNKIHKPPINDGLTKSQRFRLRHKGGLSYEKR